MEIILNNKPIQTQAANLEALAAELNLPQQGVAIAVANKMVARTAWTSTPLTDGLKITVLKAFCGG